MREMAVDPVCGMEVREDENSINIEHKGERIYFCSRHCLKKYVKEHDVKSDIGGGLHRGSLVQAEDIHCLSDNSVSVLCILFLVFRRFTRTSKSEKLVVTSQKISVSDQFPRLEKIEHFFN